MNCSRFHATSENGAFDRRVSHPDYLTRCDRRRSIMKVLNILVRRYLPLERFDAAVAFHETLIGQKARLRSAKRLDCALTTTNTICDWPRWPLCW